MIRCGIGYDAHRLVPGRDLVLGGVKIPFTHGLAGHSDADVLCHAVADSVLGASGLGELGELYPATDEQWRNASSLVLLAGVAARLASVGGRVLWIDAVLVADAPKLRTYREAMRHNVATALGVQVAIVSIKPKSNEGLGFEGAGEGMSARAVATIEWPE